VDEKGKNGRKQGDRTTTEGLKGFTWRARMGAGGLPDIFGLA